MVEISDEEYKLLNLYRNIFKHLRPEVSGAYFICGESGEKDVNGLPEKIIVCPAMGVGFTSIYKKT